MNDLALNLPGLRTLMYHEKCLIWETLNLSTCADSSPITINSLFWALLVTISTLHFFDCLGTFFFYFWEFLAHFLCGAGGNREREGERLRGLGSGFMTSVCQWEGFKKIAWGGDNKHKNIEVTRLNQLIQSKKDMVALLITDLPCANSTLLQNQTIW